MHKDKMQSPAITGRHASAQGAVAESKPTTEFAPEVTQALSLFTSRFAPAASPAKATHSYSTEELLRAISTLLPGYTMPAAKEVIHHLQEQGYKFDLMPAQFSLEYKWLLAER